MGYEKLYYRCSNVIGVIYVLYMQNNTVTMSLKLSIWANIAVIYMILTPQVILMANMEANILQRA